jgi:hypothetical protein
MGGIHYPLPPERVPALFPFAFVSGFVHA